MHFISHMFTTSKQSEMMSRDQNRYRTATAARPLRSTPKNILTQRACLSENDELRLRGHSSGGWYRPALADGSAVDKVRISSLRRDRARETRFIRPASLPNARVPWRIPPREKKRNQTRRIYGGSDEPRSSSPADFPAPRVSPSLPGVRPIGKEKSG